jgi:hypothetical protein
MIAMPEGTTAVYDEDLYLWSQQQAEALRAAARSGANLSIDWENVAEEIESLGRRDRHGVISRLETLIAHLLKLEHSSQVDPRRGWTVTVERDRHVIRRLLKESPSLRARLAELVAEARQSGLRGAVTALETVGEYEAAHVIERTGIDYTVDQVMGDWIPPGPLDP